MIPFSFLRVLVISAVICFASYAEDRQIYSSDRTERCFARSDLVARTKVLTVDFIGKPARIDSGRIIIDVFVYGRLVTVQLLEPYVSKQSPPPNKFYIFQKGALGGIGQAKLEAGKEYILFMKLSGPPDVTKNNIETDPPLPNGFYYSILNEQHGVIYKNDTIEFSRISAILFSKQNKR